MLPFFNNHPPPTTTECTQEIITLFLCNIFTLVTVLLLLLSSSLCHEMQRHSFAAARALHTIKRELQIRLQHKRCYIGDIKILRPHSMYLSTIRFIMVYIIYQAGSPCSIKAECMRNSPDMSTIVFNLSITLS